MFLEVNFLQINFNTKKGMKNAEETLDNLSVLCLDGDIDCFNTGENFILILF